MLLYNFRSTTKRQHKLVPLREKQQRVLYILSLARSLGRINKKELILYSLSDKAAEEILISFPIIKRLLLIREKLSDVKASTKPVWSSLTMVTLEKGAGHSGGLQGYREVMQGES